MTVHLVGAGPGDPDLLTIRAARLIAGADVVVHDALIDAGVLALVPPGAELIDVGKRPGRPVPQEMITALLVQLGRTHGCVVRLKGGDPYVFGRGGEEALGLLDAGVPFEVVPGLTSAVAAPALAGIPVTQRGLAAAVTVVTGHRRPGDEGSTDWDALARLGGTIVVLMGVAERRVIAERLMAGGRSGDTPVAAVERAGTARQRVSRCRLDQLAGLQVEPPATIVVGPVAALDLTPHWSGNEALVGREIAVTLTPCAPPISSASEARQSTISSDRTRSSSSLASTRVCGPRPSMRTSPGPAIASGPRSIAPASWTA